MSFHVSERSHLQTCTSWLAGETWQGKAVPQEATGATRGVEGSGMEGKFLLLLLLEFALQIWSCVNILCNYRPKLN